MAGADGDERKSSKKIVVFSFYLTLCGTLLLTQLQYSNPPPFLCFSLQAVSGSVMSFKMAPASCVLCFLIKKKASFKPFAHQCSHYDRMSSKQ